ncbi:MAG: cytochrome C [Burkholderiales bacterium]|nr:cytochrome C [Burkholderiales bacterium]
MGFLARLFALLAFAVATLPAAAQQAPAATALPDTGCIACHEAKAKKIQVPGQGGGKPRSLKAVPTEDFRQGAHGRLQCVACHTGITDNPKPGETHARPAGAALSKPDCQGCHQELQDKIQRGEVRGTPLLDSMARNIDAHKRSLHAKPNADDPTRPNANCVDCHNVHTFKIPPKGAAGYAAWRAGIPQVCGTCHEDQLESYRASVHHKHNQEKGDGKAAVCSDCHSAHLVTNTSADRFKVGVTTNCGGCHKERYETFQDTFHGAIVTLGYGYTAKCYNCHGSHEILSAADPKSKVHPDNRLKTCQSCHNPKKGLPEVSAGFATFQPHADPHDFKNYPTVFLAYWGMIGLLVGTFGFFWVHTILWFYREYKERKARGGEHLVRVDEVAGPVRGKHFQRFNSVQRGAHLLFALSLMVLTLTGMPLFYPEAPWAAAIMRLVGGPQSAGYIHRMAAVLFAAIFVWHLFYVAYRISRNWKHFNFFGPDSLVPWIQDLKGILAMFRWFFGLGPRPVFDRWTYWEKFDYWAPFWGVTIIGVSGLVMWLPHLFGQFLPGWAFNVATIMHGEEAFLAVVFLFTVHFFNNHFRPDKFPVDVVMFTGTQSLEEFKREHELQYQRLVASGELEQLLVDPPSALHVKASKALAFVLIFIGLTLLTLVAIGFLTQA